MSVENRGWIQVRSGGRFYPFAPRAEDVHVEDIAHALAHQCRFAGHCSSFYSVAEHSVRVADAVADAGGRNIECLWGLLHDASEAYLTDILRPLKHTVAFDGYRAAEQNVMLCIARALDLPLPMPSVVDHFDKVLLATEARDLMPQREAAEWAWMPPPLVAAIEPLTPTAARATFLRRYAALRGAQP